MSQISIFITVTKTVTGSAVPTLNATQIREMQETKEKGQIVALVALGFFVLLALVLLTCWGVLRMRRPKPQPVAVNPDMVRHGSGAFLPIIRGRRKLSKVGWEASRPRGSIATSQQTLVGTGTTPQTPGARRISMWADEALSSTPSIPEAPLASTHSRAPSTESIQQHESRYGHDRTDSNISSQSTVSTPSYPSYHSHQGYGYVPQYHENASSMDVIPLGSQQLPIVPPKISLAEHGRPRVEPTRVGYDRGVVSPVVSPIDDTRMGISRYPPYDGGRPRHYGIGSDMYA
jgi:hypothetical protein